MNVAISMLFLPIIGWHLVTIIYAMLCYVMLIHHIIFHLSARTCWHIFPSPNKHTHTRFIRKLQKYNKSNKTAKIRKSLNNIHITNNTVSKFYSQAVCNLTFIVTCFNICKVICFPVLFRTHKDFHNRSNNNILITPQAVQETKFLLVK